MVYLRKVRNLCSDIITWAWLDRLEVKYPRLARSIKAFVFSVAFGLAAWYYLDQRNVIYGKYSSVQAVGPGRIVVGGLWVIASLVSAYFIFAPVKHDPIPAVKPPRAPSSVRKTPSSGRRKKRRR